MAEFWAFATEVLVRSRISLRDSGMSGLTWLLIVTAA